MGSARARFAYVELRYVKHFISLVFSVRFVNYGSFLLCSSFQFHAHDSVVNPSVDTKIKRAIFFTNPSSIVFSYYESGPQHQWHLYGKRMFARTS